MRIKKLVNPTRCEICHKTDCFDLETLFCSRCKDVVNNRKLMIEAEPILTKEQAIKLVENRFKELEKQRTFINKKQVAHLVVTFICLLPMDILLLNVQLGKSLGLLLILNLLLMSIGLITAKYTAQNHFLNINQQNHLVTGLIELAKIVRKYRGKTNM